MELGLSARMQTGDSISIYVLFILVKYLEYSYQESKIMVTIQYSLSIESVITIILTTIAAVAACLSAYPVVKNFFSKRRLTFNDKEISRYNKDSAEFISFLSNNSLKVVFISAIIRSDEDISISKDYILGEYIKIWLNDGTRDYRDDNCIINIDYSNSRESGIFRLSGGVWYIQGKFLVSPGIMQHGLIHFKLKARNL